MKEAYVSFETAKLLKEKGFDEPCNAWYVPYENGYVKFFMHEEASDSNHFEDAPWVVSRPTHQMAMAWLREKYNKHCQIGYDIQLEWYYDIIDLKETTLYDYEDMKCWYNESNFESYEEAIEAALKYALENLI